MKNKSETINSYAGAAIYSPSDRESKSTIKHKRDGYTFKEKSNARSALKMPLFCPYEECRRPTNTIDDGYILEYGVCGNCYVMYIEDRKQPLIDVELYAKRFKDRGF